jgi:ATP-dependent Lon protease
MIILPQLNQRDMDEVPKELFGNIRFVFVDNVKQVFREALKEKIVPPAATGTRPARVPQVASQRSA